MQIFFIIKSFATFVMSLMRLVLRGELILYTECCRHLIIFKSADIVSFFIKYYLQRHEEADPKGQLLCL